MGEMAQTFISEIQWLSLLKYRATSLSTSLFFRERRSMFSKSVRWTHVKFTTFTARNAAVDNGEGALIHACELMPNNKIGFRSGNRCVRVKRRTRATTGTRKDIRERVPEKGYPMGHMHGSLLRNVKMTSNNIPNFVVKEIKF